MQESARNHTKSTSKICMQNLHARNSLAHKIALQGESGRNETKGPLGINFSHCFTPCNFPEQPQMQQPRLHTSDFKTNAITKKF